jgi:hypothetical protein
MSKQKKAQKKKNMAAVSLGRLGGLARARSCTKQQLSEIGRKGAAVRSSRVSNPLEGADLREAG